MSLFNLGDLTLHSGLLSYWKIDCDYLSSGDWKTLAWLIGNNFRFSHVIGVPTGGTDLAEHLLPYRQKGYPTLIVDDVLTTGMSMANYRKSKKDIGVVVFARGKCPDWITPIFQLGVTDL